MYDDFFEDRGSGMTAPGSFAIRGRTLVPIVPGGMGAGAVMGASAGRKREAAAA
jgi:hypothetical protein